jgi:HD-GYP domain-containing protein (c-di-GMP phosphodiesterase class II)
VTKVSVIRPNKEDLQAFQVSELMPDSVTDFDLWVEVETAFTLYATAPYKWRGDELERLKDKGRTVLYYFTRDAPKAKAYSALHKVRSLDLLAAPKERILNLTDAAAELTQILYIHGLSTSLLAKGQAIASAMVDCVQEDPSAIAAIGLLANHDYYTYYHSARVAAYAIAVSLQLSLTDRKRLESVAIGCMLHDIGKVKIDLGVLNKKDKLTKDEMLLVRRHPVFGDEIVADSILDTVPRSIILHHHERLDGTGYPNNLTEKEQLEEVKIAAVADLFDALTTNRPYQQAMSKYQALDFIRHRLLHNIHKDSFRALVEILGNDLSKSGEK